MSSAPVILGERSSWLVLDKPAGWHTVDAARTDGAPTIEDWLRHERPELAGLEECGLVHRLDRDTSGCLLVAKSAAERRRWRDAFVGRAAEVAVRKVYLALVAPGIDGMGEWTLAFASRHRGSAKVTVSRQTDAGQVGSCRWRCLRRAQPKAIGRSPGSFDLLEVELVGPGRRHQIRAGFAAIGHPLAGDALYGGRPIDVPGVTADPDESADGPLCLHAFRLEFDDTVVESPRPAWAG